MNNSENLEESVREIQTNLEEINHKVGGSWKSLSRGILTGFGSIVGAGLAIIIIGWVLNFVGVIPAFRDQVDEFRDALRQTSAVRSITPAE